MAVREATLEKWRTFAEGYINTGQGRKAAKLSGYKGNDKTLDVTASKLLKKPEVKKMIAERRAELKAKGGLPAGDLELERERIAISTEDKREFLWNLAKECGKTVRGQDVAEHIDQSGNTVRTITIIESVFKPKEAIEAIRALNEMDGDIVPPKAPPGGGLSIEQLLLSITQNNN